MFKIFIDKFKVKLKILFINFLKRYGRILIIFFCEYVLNKRAKYFAKIYSKKIYT